MNKSNYSTPAGQEKQNSYVLPIVIVGSVLLIGTLIALLLLKPLSSMSDASRAPEIGLSGSYEEVRKDCPTNVELAWACFRNFNVQSSAEVVELTALSTLKSKGYRIKRLDRGYDGPNQKALVAYSSQKNITLVMAATDTDNQAYRNSQGNVRVQVYWGRTKYDNHDLTPEWK